MTTEEFLSGLDGVRRAGRGWMAKCPAHDDRTPSLSVREGEGGKILLHDFGGCSVGEICAAMGLRLADLFGDDPVSSEEIVARRKRRAGEQHRREHEQEFAGRRIDWLREAEHLIRSARNIDISCWSNERLEDAMNHLAKAYQVLEEESIHE